VGTAAFFTISYLNLDSRGISPKRLAASRPGIISHELRCFVLEGKWESITISVFQEPEKDR